MTKFGAKNEESTKEAEIRQHEDFCGLMQNLAILGWMNFTEGCWAVSIYNLQVGYVVTIGASLYL